MSREDLPPIAGASPGIALSFAIIRETERVTTSRAALERRAGARSQRDPDA